MEERGAAPPGAVRKLDAQEKMFQQRERERLQFGYSEPNSAPKTGQVANRQAVH